MMAFPDEYHLNTLDALLASCVALQPGVKVHSILSTLMERLASYAEAADEPVAAMQTSHAFDCFLAAARTAGQKYASARGVRAWESGAGRADDGTWATRFRTIETRTAPCSPRTLSTNPVG